MFTSVALTPAQMSFSGHETFTFRYGWLKKGIDAVRESPSIFAQDEALVKLGVGKNMVRSIRHWCQAMQLLQEEPSENPQKQDSGLQPSDIANKLFADEGGWDPYLEDPASLWLLHWLLVSKPEKATTWYLAFYAFGESDFTKERMQEFLQDKTNQAGKRTNEKSLSRDIDCFLRTYVPTHLTKQNVPEETLDCPLVELNLLRALQDGRTYRFMIGPKPSLPAQIFGFALLKYFEAACGERQSIAIENILYGLGGPGQAFKLDENSVIDYLEQLRGITNGAILLDETAGPKQLYRQRKCDPILLLERYFLGESV